LNVVFEARREMVRPVFNFHFLNVDGAWVFGFSKRVSDEGREPESVQPGQRVRITGEISNRLVPGRYFVDCWISRDRAEGDVALHVLTLMDFFVYGTAPGTGSVSVRTDLRAVVEPGP
jgi:hypothetical protein